MMRFSLLLAAALAASPASGAAQGEDAQPVGKTWALAHPKVQ